MLFSAHHMPIPLHMRRSSEFQALGIRQCYTSQSRVFLHSQACVASSPWPGMQCQHQNQHQVITLQGHYPIYGTATQYGKDAGAYPGNYNGWANVSASSII